MTQTESTAQLIMGVLRQYTRSPMFTLNGGHIWGFYLAEDAGRLIDVRHEQTAAFAAEGWAKLTRTLGLAAVTAGPGVTNSITAIAQAHQHDSPMVVLGGRAPHARWGMGSLQEMDHLPLVRPITRWAGTVEAADQAWDMAGAAAARALTHRTGPTYLDVPTDVFMDSAEVPDEPLPRPHIGEPDPDQVDRALALIQQAERPVLVAGSSVWWGHAEAELKRLVEGADIPTMLNGLARGMLPPTHPLYFSRSRSLMLGEADLIVVVGAPLDFRLNFGMPPLFNPEAQLVYIDIDRQKQHRPAGAAVIGDLKRSLSLLADRKHRVLGHPRWIAHLRDHEFKARIRDSELCASPAIPIHPARLVYEIDRLVDQDAIMIGDGGDFVSFAGRLIERDRPGLWLDPGPFGALGSGPGYAIAAQAAYPDRQVVLLSGDGAFGFAATDFDTMVRHRLPVVCVIGNNGIWATEKSMMLPLLGQAIACDLAPGTRYDRLVEALGGYGELVERPEEIRPALRRAFAAGVPACINVITDPEAQYPRSSVLM